MGAGTSRFQRASLRAWESFEAFRARRQRATLYHSALKLVEPEETYTLELTPAFDGRPAAPIMTGPVGFRGASRFRLFRYELRRLPAEHLPDEQWAVESPVMLSEECSAIERVLSFAPSVPAHTWGRRIRGTDEMWTSDSVVSWLLVRAGVDLTSVTPPKGGRAPGWGAGIRLATER